MISVPTQAEEYAKLLDLLSQAQSSSAMLAHLTRAQSSAPKDTAIADGWIAVSELMKRLSHQITQLAQGRLN